jgi:hypothetical protein
MNLLKQISFWSFLLMHFACKEMQKNETDILSPEQMSAIIADMQLAETFSVIPSTQQPFVRDSLDSYYQGIFEGHKTNHQVFYHSLAYYSQEPKELELIYRNSIELLNKELELYHSVDENSQEAIMAFSMQQIVNILSETPFKEWLLSDEKIDINTFRDSVFIYLEQHDSIILNQGINLSSFKYSYIINTAQPVLFNQMRAQLKMYSKELEDN